jgi:hypothetical protein
MGGLGVAKNMLLQQEILTDLTGCKIRTSLQALRLHTEL